MPITQRFALRKLSVGVVSVLLGTSIALGLNGETAQADTSANRITPQPAAAQTKLPAVVSANESQSNINTTTSTNKELAPTTPVDETAYTVTNVKAHLNRETGLIVLAELIWPLILTLTLLTMRSNREITLMFPWEFHIS